jgi:hypothetical protein
MSAKNFWITCEVEGRQRPIRVHTTGENSGFDLYVEVAEDGGYVRALTVTGRSYHDRRLVLRIYQSQALVWRGEFRRYEEDEQ